MAGKVWTAAEMENLSRREQQAIFDESAGSGSWSLRMSRASGVLGIRFGTTLTGPSVHVHERGRSTGSGRSSGGGTCVDSVATTVSSAAPAASDVRTCDEVDALLAEQCRRGHLHRFDIVPKGEEQRLREQDHHCSECGAAHRPDTAESVAVVGAEDAPDRRGEHDGEDRDHSERAEEREDQIVRRMPVEGTRRRGEVGVPTRGVRDRMGDRDGDS